MLVIGAVFAAINSTTLIVVDVALLAMWKRPLPNGVSAWVLGILLPWLSIAGGFTCRWRRS